MVLVSGFDCGKFWNVQSLSIVIWTGSGCLLPSITPKYGGSLQNFSAPAAGETVASNRARRTSRGKPSVGPRDIRDLEIFLTSRPSGPNTSSAACPATAIPRRPVIPEISSSVPRAVRGPPGPPPRPRPREGGERRNPDSARTDTVFRRPPPRELPRDAGRIGGHRRPAGTRRARNFGSEIASAI